MLESLRTLARDTRGLALTEFAFAAPIFLMLVLTGLELSNLALSHLRVSQMAMTVADNAGRVTSGIDEANIYEVFTGADYASSGLDFEPNGRMVPFSLAHNCRSGSDEGSTIVWQRCLADDPSVPPCSGHHRHCKHDPTHHG